MTRKAIRLRAIIRRRKRYLAVVALNALLLSSPLALAQHPEIDALAMQAAQDLARKKMRVISISFFRNDKRGISEAGRLLALEFSAALAKANPQIQIIDTPRLKALAEERRLFPSDVFDSEVARQLSASLGATAQIRGILTTVGDSLKLDIEWVVAVHPLDESQPSHPKQVGKTTAILPQTAELASLLSRGNSEDASGFLVAGTPGVTYPQCVHCPAPVFSDKARTEKFSGSVVLLITVTPEGTGVNPLITKRLGAGLDEAALEAVRKWHFVPATDANGKATAMRVSLEVIFRYVR